MMITVSPGVAVPYMMLSPGLDDIILSFPSPILSAFRKFGSSTKLLTVLVNTGRFPSADNCVAKLERVTAASVVVAKIKPSARRPSRVFTLVSSP